jgi:cytidylate kinase
VPWTVFDRQLMDRTLEEHNLPKALADALSEDHRSTLRDLVDELIGIVPPPWEIAPKIAETVLHLAYAGHVILVGRGANLITARLPNVFRIRLVGSLARRAGRLCAARGMSEEAAMQALQAEDRARARYARANFQADIDDSLLYHLVINTDTLPLEEMAQLVADAAGRRFRARQH